MSDLKEIHKAVDRFELLIDDLKSHSTINLKEMAEDVNEIRINAKHIVPMLNNLKYFRTKMIFFGLLAGSISSVLAIGLFLQKEPNAFSNQRIMETTVQGLKAFIIKEPSSCQYNKISDTLVCLSVVQEKK